MATTETLTQHTNLNYFYEAVSWQGEARSSDTGFWWITDKSEFDFPVDDKPGLLGLFDLEAGPKTLDE